MKSKYHSHLFFFYKDVIIAILVLPFLSDNDFVTLSSSPVVYNNTFVSIMSGVSVNIPLNISARPANVVIHKREGVTPSNILVTVPGLLMIIDAEPDIAGRYVITLTNPAGTTSAPFYLQVNSELRSILLDHFSWFDRIGYNKVKKTTKQYFIICPKLCIYFSDIYSIRNLKTSGKRHQIMSEFGS